MHKRLRRGFSILELLIFVTISGTVIAMAMPKVNSALRQRRVIAASVAVASDLEAAFSLAARNRRPMRLSYDASSGEVRVSDRAAGTVYRRRPLRASSEFGLSAVSASPSPVDFFPNGLTSAGLTITLTNGAYTRRVIVTRTGLTRITL
jgi:Tfp pilus assembly protein FimT